MRKVSVTNNVSLDGVMQAPGRVAHGTVIDEYVLLIR